MKEAERRAIVWDTIERTAFQPSSDKDRSTWLGVYAKTLHVLWEKDPVWARLAPDDEFIVPIPKLKCKYTIQSAIEYSVSLRNSSTDHCYWQNQVAPKYLSKGSLHSAGGRYPVQLIKKHLRDDIKAVLNGMIFHPRCHTHLEDLGIQQVQLDQSKDGLKLHDIRIGGGIENPYIFLFHLRFQFCLESNRVRKAEKQRLIDLFERSIKVKNVEAKALFGYTR
ncbi:MAG: hypothetical protein HQ517_10990 [SAR324 cluster bacterium]|nr:hypothetical protein [SAR324 cluster bacterium]